jgi:hypothetical protein
MPTRSLHERKSDGAIFVSNTQSVAPHIIGSNSAESLAMRLRSGKHGLFGVRIVLPRNITTVVLCDDSTTHEELLLKTLTKLKVSITESSRKVEISL